MASDDAAEAMLQKMLQQRNEPLDDELRPYLEETTFGTCLKHPLVFQVPLHNPGMANEALRFKSKVLAEMREKKDWMGIIWLYERPYRLDAFMEFQAELSDADYWNCLRSVWIDSENIWQNYQEWRTALENPARIATRYGYFLTEADSEALEKMDDPIKIYRGCHGEVNEDGLSWTVDHDRAAWFARRFHEDTDAIVIHASVRKDDVIAYFDGRGEREIVADPSVVTIESYEILDSPDNDD